MITNSVLALVDWDSARRIVNAGTVHRRRRPDREIEDAIEALQDEIADVISPTSTIVRVRWRLYHGWHEGTSATADRRLFENYISRYSARTIGKISFGRDFEFGDQMLCRSWRLPLRYTLRSQPVRGQKMVDTALISDLLQAARTSDYDRLVVVGDDDDLLPGLLVAESWGASIHLLRLNNQSNLPLLAGRDRGFPMSIMRRRER